MAKRSQKGNREIRKPKSAKPKLVAQTLLFAKPPALGVTKRSGGKQAR